MTARTNEAWLSELRMNGEVRSKALEDLRLVIQRGLPYALSRWLSPDQPQFSALVEEVTQETLLRVLDQLDTFEGRSQFTTWVHKIAVRIALTELRRKDAPPPPGLLADSQAGPEISAERIDMLARVRRIIEEELTERQRQALILLGVQDLPIEDAAKKLKTNRNALYKLLHDARLRLRTRLAREEIAPHEVLALFETK